MINDNLIKVANQMNGTDNVMNELQTSLSALKAKRDQSLFNEHNVLAQIEKQLAALKIHVTQYVSTKDGRLIAQMNQDKQNIEQSLLLISPGGIYPDQSNYNKYFTVYKKILLEI